VFVGAIARVATAGEGTVQLEDLDHLRKFVAPEFIFGEGARRLVAQYVRNLGARKPLVVSDPGVIDAGWAAAATAELDAASIPYALFGGVTPNPKDHEVHAGAEVYVGEGCDALVAVGGGSPMDCAKGIGIVCSNGGSILDYVGVDEVPRPCPPMVFIPTTAGTAADVSQFAIITDTRRRTKSAIVSKAVVPDISLTDPETSYTMDRELTSATGLDAFCHAIEALVSNASSPITDVHALAAAHLVHENVLAAIEQPRGVKARRAMMLASLQAGLAFSNASLGAVHAMAHSLGGLRDLAHGECNALLLPYVMDFNFDAARPAYRRLGAVLGLSGLENMSADAERGAVIGAVRELGRAAGTDRRLSELGVKAEDLPVLAEMAAQDVCLVTNPRPASQADLEKIYEQAL
jgi:alcohol dehydrogenase